MARSRNIKPGFFSNDVLGELPPLARLLFAGLWTICDRAGRVEDRPKKIKAEVLPYDDCNCDELLSMLEASGFIARYQQDGIAAIQVLTWEKHQNPHCKEAPSSLPALCKHGASTVQAPDEASPLPALAGLIPDSGFLIPDSLKEQCTHTPLAREWVLPKTWGEWALKESPHWTADVVRLEAERFADHWRASSGTSADWEATWRLWCRDQLTQKAHPKEPVKATKAPAVTVPSDADKATAAYLAEQAEHARKASSPPDLQALKTKLAIARAA